MNDLESQLLALVEQFGLGALFDVALGLTTHENIQVIADAVAKRAIRLASNAEAKAVLDKGV